MSLPINLNSVICIRIGTLSLDQLKNISWIYELSYQSLIELKTSGIWKIWTPVGGGYVIAVVLDKGKRPVICDNYLPMSKEMKQNVLSIKPIKNPKVNSKFKKRIDEEIQSLEEDFKLQSYMITEAIQSDMKGIKFDTFSKFYKLTHDYTPEQEEIILEELSFDLRQKVFEFLETIYFKEILDNLSICIFNSTQLDRFNKLMNLTGITYHVEDITNQVILDEVKFDDATYLSMVKPFLMSNLTSDIVLDKISIKGISSLSEVDKLILEQN